jgi:hypothetical protein
LTVARSVARMAECLVAALAGPTAASSAGT